ncbi:MAG: spermidine/putrescine ABC transporter permease [Spirochaetes bacterium GWF1_31_7]|nr:MAG: spermidine/putrescine ABC transporter permease [Spirochaetes bacterium GWE1_32_154]OHD48315.1 MAG: spermidine/putrescine ABC transporter permease [Spirochaetes bacterium GWE2_31_10]OHD49303.1 MAG: spermidine/putrescine ABC transporter permease [Spirochaetes bacterium GWF1_31_7]OHD81133.1 MAG: spermidine/putrescine ABC transporter permease [Spirochaetes bacterium RIFOXYB1_FULL_32_8]HBD92957.1 spermidine/putrescine ABC transporter permease [Spirochaetia bacterium]
MKKINYGKIYTAPLTMWITFFFVIPTSIIFLYSFLKKKLRGGVLWEFSIDGYTALINQSFFKVVWFTVVISIFATFLTLLLAIPTSYFIARSKRKNLYLFLVIVPFWTNFLIRIFAWISILGNNGFLNNMLLSLGIIKSPLMLLYNQYAIIVVTVYTYLPYAILPLYSTIEKFDFSLLEAARDLGASKLQSLFKIFLPGIRSGIMTATIFTFIPALGSYAIPLLVGGQKSFMIGNLIARELKVTMNWPLASSMSVVLTVVTTIGIFIFLNTNKNKSELKNEN